MKLKEYAKKINDLAKKHGDLEVVYAADDEGNNYYYVYHTPSVFDVDVAGKTINAVCVN